VNDEATLRVATSRREDRDVTPAPADHVLIQDRDGTERAGGPRLGLGCVRLGSARGRGWRHDVRLVEEAVDRGVSVFDTADAYVAGASERVLGQALRRRRAEVVIATKVGYRFRQRSRTEQTMRRALVHARGRLRRANGGSENGAPGASGYRDQDFSVPYLRRALDASLRRLQTDYVDVLQLHGPPCVLPEVIEELGDLVPAGKVRSLGIGAESVAMAAEWTGVAGVDVVQLPFGMLDPEAAASVLPHVATSGVQVWARGVLGGGLLRMADEDPIARADPKWPLICSLLTLSRRAGVEVDEMAIGFVRAHAGVTTLLLGISSSEHLRRNLELMRAPALDAALVAEIRALVRGEDA
jgi:aryl-alcohol dehydrogenase-like predicted oxidoreductase